MSEEEIIDKINLYLRYADVFFEIPGRNNVVKTIKGLLDLYNKEKEKNKELENADLTTVHMNGFYDGEKKWKDKIREKIKEYEDTYMISDIAEDGLKEDYKLVIIVLEELLEENKSNENDI